MFYVTFLGKESILLTTALVIGLLVAIALGSTRMVIIAAVLLMCVLFPVALAVVVPAIAGGIYYYCLYMGS